jgi:type IV secretion system protein VirB11
VSVTLDHLLLPIAGWLDDPATEEICIQEPNVCWVYSRGTFTRHEVQMTAEEIEDIAIVAAAARQQDVGNGKPLLATDLMGRGRLQAVLRPCVDEGRPSLTIRRGSDAWPTLAGLAAAGLFKNTHSKRLVQSKTDTALVSLYKDERWEEFFRSAVLAKKVIIGCGITASGKTHFSKAMISEIPSLERLITIEDAPELRGLSALHPNHVSLYYNKDANTGDVGAAELVEASLRMRPERLFIQEIRDGGAAIAFLTALQTGHSGMTTIHASHCEAAFNRLRVLIKQTPGGAAVSDSDITSELSGLIDIVVHSTREDGPFEVDEVWFRPVSLGETM